MARKDRPTSDPVALEHSLQQQPYRFGFSPTMRRLECVYQDKPRPGRSLGIKDDAIRLAQEPSTAFAPSTLAHFTPAEGEHPPRLSVNFFGLFGPNGPLPLHLTEYARDRLRNADDATFSRFADIFHHRMMSLFYRAWADAQPTVSFDRPESDRFADYVGALCGMGAPALRKRDAMPDLAKLFFAGQLSTHTRHAEGIRAILHAFFQVPVQIQQFVGTWFTLPDDAVCRLGDNPQTGTLGKSAVIGGRIWSTQQKFRIVFGPLRFKDFQRLLPGGESLPRLVAMVRNYLGDELTWDVQLILKKEELPPWKLGQSGQLGWITRLTRKPIEQDIDEVFLHPVAGWC